MVADGRQVHVVPVGHTGTGGPCGLYRDRGHVVPAGHTGTGGRWSPWVIQGQGAGEMARVLQGRKSVSACMRAHVCTYSVLFLVVNQEIS